MTTVNVNEDKYSVTVTEGATTVVTVKAPGPQGPGFPDGNLGDVTSSNTGASVVVNSGAITNAKVNDSAAIAGTKISPDFGSQNITTTGNAVFGGNLTVSGSVTTIDTTTLRVEDKNIELGKVGSPTDITADGGGITLLGDTNHTFNWVNATDSWTSSEHIALGDNKKLQLGDSQDLAIFHDGTQSIIQDNGTGGLRLRGENTISLASANGNEVYARFIKDDSVELYHDNTLKFTTKSYGAVLNGALVATSDIKVNSYVGKLIAGTSNEFTIQHNDTDTFIENTVGNLHIRPKASEEGIKLIPDAAVELYYDNALKFTTEGTGVKVFGMLVPSASGSHPLGIDVLRWNGLFMSGDIDLLDNNKLKFGNDDDLQIYHDGQNSNIDNSTNTLKIKSNRIRLNDFTNDHQMIHAVADGAVELYFDNVQKLRTTSSGITVSGSVTTQDMNMSNLNGTANEVDGSKGSWSIQEGADDLFIINRVNGKKYKFNLTEIS